MYFEDIFNKIAPLWKRNFSLEGIEKTETYVESIRKNYNELDNTLYESGLSWWEFSMLFTIYQTLTAFGLKKWKKQQAKNLHFDEIPITLFEEYFRKNLEPEDEFEGNEEYLKQYKGLRGKITD
ncbi:MAG: hypothetical protein AAF934_04920 [Bacteroidota bacterium]